MTNFRYLKLTKSKKIRYLMNGQKNSDYVVFLHGFMSDLEGKKPKTFFNFAKRNKIGFQRLNTLVMAGHQENLPKEIYQNGQMKLNF